MGNAEEDHETRSGEFPDDFACHGDVRPAGALHDCSHEPGFCHGNGAD
jgi:hypothetical protein